jgi:hypothetical protein
VTLETSPEFPTPPPRPGPRPRSSSRQAFAWWNGHWQVTPGTYRLMAGDSSSSLPLVAHVEVTR